jgi:hypothetical protein
VDEGSADSYGRYVGILTSSDLLTSVVPCQITMGAASKSVEFVWDNQDNGWSSGSEIVEPGQTSTEAGSSPYG